MNDPIFTLTIGDYFGETPAMDLPEGVPDSLAESKMGYFTGSLSAYKVPSALDDMELPELDCIGTYAGATECGASPVPRSATDGVPEWIPFNLDYATVRWSGKITGLVKADWPEASAAEYGGFVDFTQKKYAPSFKVPAATTWSSHSIKMPEFVMPDGALDFDVPDMYGNFSASPDFKAPTLAGVDGVGVSASFGELGNFEDFTESLEIDLEPVVALDIATSTLTVHLKGSVSGAKCPVDGYPASGHVWLDTEQVKGRVMLSGARFCADDREADWVVKGSLAGLTVGDHFHLRDVEFKITASAASQSAKKGRSLLTVSEATAEAKYSQAQAKAYADGGSVNTDPAEMFKDVDEIEKTADEVDDDVSAADVYAMDLTERAIATAKGPTHDLYVEGKTVDFKEEKYGNQKVALKVEITGTARLGSVVGVPWAGAIPAAVKVGFTLEPRAEKPKFDEDFAFAASGGFSMGHVKSPMLAFQVGLEVHSVDT